MNTITADIKEYLNHCAYEKNLSKKTIKSYEIDLIQFVKFLVTKKYSLLTTEITKKELREYLEEISVLKPKSIKRKIASIKALFNFLEFEDKISLNPWRKMQVKIREPKQLPKVMDIREITKILKMAYAESNKPHITEFSELEYKRNIVVLELLFATGARVSEISNLKYDNINIVTGAITIKGKGEKERILQVCNKETLMILKDYYKLAAGKIESSGGFFLVNRLGNKLSDQSIRGIVKSMALKAGIKKHITPHMFRHSFATLLLEKDVDIKYIQSLLGHSSILTTQIYTHVNRHKQIQILRKKHPRKDLTMYLF